MVSIKKRLVALLMTLVMALGVSASAFAAEPTNVITAEPSTTVSDDISTQSSLGKVIAAGATTINGGSGTLSVYLSSSNFWADIIAQIDYCSSSSPVVVTVRTPDGDTIELGTISGSGSQTYSYELFYAPAGTYTFYFLSAMPSEYGVSAFIYD